MANSFDLIVLMDILKRVVNINSVPIQLLTVISMLADDFGTHNKGFSQKSLTLSQLIQGNFKKHAKKTETKISKISKKT